jgi:deazaflavin-dependent oxidoreductase (nitroreductase family)
MVGHWGMLCGMRRPPAAAKSFNKIVIRLAGRRFFPWAMLRHRGRKSGKTYAVPVAVIPTQATFIIAMPWGEGSDWVRNVRAAGRCTIRWKGAEYDCTEPTFVDKDTALAAARGVTRFALRRIGFPGFLQLNRAAA